MPSTVCAGSSNAVSRVPGPPPRTSALAATGRSNTTAVTPEPSLASSAWPTRTPTTSVIRLRMRTEVSHPRHRGHWNLATAILARAYRPYARRDYSCRTDCRHHQLSLALRITAGPALSRFPRRHLARTLRGSRAGEAGPQGDGAGGASVRARLLDGVRRPWRQRERDRLADPRLFRTARDRRRRRDHRDGPALSRP